MRWLRLGLYVTCIIFHCKKKNNTGITMAPVLLKLDWIHGHEVLLASPVMQSAKLKGQQSYFGTVVKWQSCAFPHLNSHIHRWADRQFYWRGEKCNNNCPQQEQSSCETVCVLRRIQLDLSLPPHLSLGQSRKKHTHTHSHNPARSPRMAVITDTGKLKEGYQACSVGGRRCPQGCTPSRFKNYKYTLPLCHCAAWGEAQNCKTDRKKTLLFSNSRMHLGAVSEVEQAEEKILLPAPLL